MSQVLVHDHENKKSSVEIDSELLLNNIIEMRGAGMDVNYHTVDSHHPNTLPGYSVEKGTYYSLVDTYEKKTGNRMNKW